jgi:hypothetical protein
VVGLLGGVHALGGEDADGYLFSEEVVDDGPGNFGVEELLRLGVELTFFGVPPHQLLQSFLVNIVIHLAPDHALIEVESLQVPSPFRVLLLENPLNDSTRFPLLLDE